MNLINSWYIKNSELQKHSTRLDHLDLIQILKFCRLATSRLLTKDPFSPYIRICARSSSHNPRPHIYESSES